VIDIDFDVNELFHRAILSAIFPMHFQTGTFVSGEFNGQHSFKVRCNRFSVLRYSSSNEKLVLARIINIPRKLNVVFSEM
jgi:hypothetical protein